MRRPTPSIIGVVAIAGLIGCGDDPDPRPASGPVGADDVVSVEAQPCDRPTARVGVGTRLGAGTVLTAAHTVDGALRRLTVDGVDADLVAVDLDRDLALLTSAGAPDRPRIEPRISPREVAAGLAVVEAGQDVVVLLGPADRRRATVDRTVRLVVDDVTDDRRSERRSHVIRPGLPAGASGAPVVDVEGRLVGVVALTGRRTDESFVVAGDEIVDVLDHAASLDGTQSDRSLTVGACE